MLFGLVSITRPLEHDVVTNKFVLVPQVDLPVTCPFRALSYLRLDSSGDESIS